MVIPGLSRGDPGGGGGCSTDTRSPGRSGYWNKELFRVARRGTTVGALMNFDNNGRGDRGSVC